MQHNDDQSTDNVDQSLSIEEAARRLNLSPPTIRRRIKQGKISAFQRTVPTGFEWRIILDQDSPTRISNDDQLAISPMHMPDQAPINAQHHPEILATPEMLKALDMIDRLQRENHELTAAAAFWQAKAHEQEERIKLLIAPNDEPETEPEPVKTRRPWWQQLFNR